MVIGKIEALLQEHHRAIAELLASINDDTARIVATISRLGVRALPGPPLLMTASGSPAIDVGKINLKPHDKQLLYKGTREKCFIVECTEGTLIITKEETDFSESLGKLSRGGSAKVCGKHIVVEATAAEGTEPLNQGTWTVEDDMAEDEVDAGKIRVRSDDVQLVYNGSRERCFIIECTEGRLIISVDGETLEAKLPRGASAKVCGKVIIVQGDADEEEGPRLSQGAWTLEKERRVF